MQQVLSWVKNNINNTFASSRKKKFGTETKDFEIIDFDNEKIRIQFDGSPYIALPLKYWMFKRTTDHLSNNRGKCVPIGARVQPPYMSGSIEEAIWKDPLPERISNYKVAPHICDILEKSGQIRFCDAYKPKSRRKLQGATLV